MSQRKYKEVKPEEMKKQNQTFSADHHLKSTVKIINKNSTFILRSYKPSPAVQVLSLVGSFKIFDQIMNSKTSIELLSNRTSGFGTITSEYDGTVLTKRMVNVLLCWNNAGRACPKSWEFQNFCHGLSR